MLLGGDPLHVGDCFSDPPSCSLPDGLLFVSGDGSERTRVVGQWRLVQGCSGQLRGLLLAHLPLPLHRQAKAPAPLVAVCVEGGAWNITSCRLYCRQGVTLQCILGGRATLVECVVGGLGPGHDRARIAVFVNFRSYVKLDRCALEFSGYLGKGAALHVNHGGRAVMHASQACAHNTLVSLAAASQVEISESVVHSPKWAMLHLQHSLGEKPRHVRDKLDRLPQWRCLHQELDAQEAAGWVRVRHCQLHVPLRGLAMWMGEDAHAAVTWDNNTLLSEDYVYPSQEES